MSERQSHFKTTNPFAEMFEMPMPFGEPFGDAGPFNSLWKRMAVDVPLTVAAETMRLASRRLEAQAELCIDLARCSSVEDAIQAHSAFFEKAADDFGTATASVIAQAQAAAGQKA